MLGSWLIPDSYTTYDETNRVFNFVLYRKFYPLPPGNYVHPTEDYGMRLGVNLRKLNESRAKLSDTAKENDGTQSKSVGHYISDSPLHFGPMSPSHSPSRGSTVEVASDDELFDDEESMTSAHRSRSLTLPSSSPISRRRPATDASKTVNRIGVSTQHDPAMESFTRLTSEPILISNGFSKHHLHSSGHTPFPLTDGALAEFAALSSTPQSSSSLIM